MEIIWGPNETGNGLALCVMHHKLFDRGAFTLSKQLQILVSDNAHGTKGFEEWLMDFHGQNIIFPQRQSYYPETEFIGWHVREVFRGNYRELSDDPISNFSPQASRQIHLSTSAPPEPIQTVTLPDLTLEEQTVFDAIETPSSHIDTIARTTQLPVNQVSRILLMLQIKGVIEQQPGQQFTKANPQA